MARSVQSTLVQLGLYLGTRPGRRLLLAVLLCAALPVRAEHLRAVSDNWPPFFMTADGQVTGIGQEILGEIARRTGDSIEMQQLPNKRAMRLLNDGEVDMVVIDSPLWNDPESLKKLVFSAELMSVQEYAYFLRDHYVDARRPADLAGKTVNILRGYSYPAFDQAFHDGSVRKFEVYNELSLLETLAKGRTDAIFMDSVAFDYNTSKYGLDRSQFRRGMQLSDAPLAIKIRPGKADLLPRFNQAIAAMKADGSITRIIEKYTGPMADRASN